MKKLLMLFILAGFVCTEPAVPQTSGRSTALPAGERFAFERIYVMLSFPDPSQSQAEGSRNILIGTRTQGLFLCDGQTFQPFKTDADAFLQQHPLYLPGAVLDDGRFLLNTTSGGAVLLDHSGRLLQTIDRNSGLPNNTVRYVYSDPVRPETQWLALDNGIARVEAAGPFSTFDATRGLESIVSQIHRHRGKLYVATGVGIVFLDETSGAFKPVNMSTTQAWDLLSVDGQLLAATGDGVYKVNGDQATWIRRSVNGDFRAMMLHSSWQDSQRIFVGLSDGFAALRWENGVWRDEGRAPGIQGQIRSLVETDDGKFWAGIEPSGVLHLTIPQNGEKLWQDMQVERYGTEHGLPEEGVAVFNISGTPYFSAQENIYRFDTDSQRFVIDSTFMVVPGQPGWGIIEDGRGQAWVMGKGIAMGTRQADGRYQWLKAPFQRFSNEGILAVYPKENGVVWFSVADGIIRYDANREVDYLVDYPALVRRVITGEDSLLFNGAAGVTGPIAPELAYAHNNLRFAYSASAYEDASRLQFQTLLEGFERDWSGWSNRTEKEYTNLPPGDYRFRVRAKNIYDHVSQEAIYSFTILPPWYRTVWAYLFYLLAAGGFIFGLIKIRTRQFKAQQRELEKTVEERTQEIRQKINELAIINSVGEAMAKQLDVQTVTRIVGDKIREIFQTEATEILLLDATTNLIHVPYSYYRGYQQVESFPLGDGLTSMILTSRKPVAHNTKEEGHELGAIVNNAEEATESYMGVPIIVGEKVLGVVSVQSYIHHAYDENSVRLLSTLSSNMGVAIENAHLFDETVRLLKDTEQRNAELAVINSVQEGLVAQMDMQGIYDLVGNQIREIFDAQVVTISSFDHQTGLEHSNFNIEKGKRFYPGSRSIDELRHHLIKTREPILINENLLDAAVNYGVKRPKPIPGTEMPKSGLWVPLVVGETAKGYISLQNVDREHAFSDSDVRLLTTLANSMSVALENARLFDETNRLLIETEQRNAELAVINSVQEGLVRELDMQAIYELVGNRLCTLFDIQGVVIRTFDHDMGLEHWQFAFEKGERQQVEPRPFNWANRELIRTRQPMLINEDYNATALKFGGKGVTVGKPPKSAVFMPLLVGDTIKGSISLQNVDREHAFTESDVRLLSTLANSMSVALENARLFDETNRLLKESEQRAAELSTVNNISKALTTQLNPDDLIKMVGEQMRELFNADMVYVALLNKENGIINFPYGYGDDYSAIKLGEGLTSQIIKTGEPILANEDVDGSYERYGIERVGKISASYLGVPIPVGGEVIGVISVQSVEHKNRFYEADVRLLNTIAANVGVALHNARLFEDAKQARADAEEANEAKSSFLSTVSHELRTPLTSVLGFAKIIKKRLDEKIFPLLQTDDKKLKRTVDQVADNLNVVVAEGERLTTLINNVLDLAKIEAGKIEWDMDRISIPEIIERAIAATSSLFDSSGLKLKKEVDANLPEVVGDQDKLIQVLINLLSNAVKFTDKGSVTCRAKQEEGEIVISIVDTGMGIAPEDQPKVFDKFKQVGDTLTNKPKGTGLGLTICKEIVEHYGGRIWVESEIDVGSTFAFALPVIGHARHDGKMAHVDFAALMTQLKQRVETTSMKAKNDTPSILVVDDEASIRELLNQNLQEAGYQVRIASNGREALEEVRREQPDLVILDVMMPEMNGFDVAAVLKNDPITMDIPILILSIVQDRERGFRLGIDRYLTKPIDTEALFREVGSLLQQGKSHRKVMVVDEDASTVKTLAEVLQARGYSVVEANGPDLVQKAVSEKPDIIIMNSMLSGNQDLVKTLRFEKGLEDVLFLVYQ